MVLGVACSVYVFTFRAIFRHSYPGFAVQPNVVPAAWCNGRELIGQVLGFSGFFDFVLC